MAAIRGHVKYLEKNGLCEHTLHSRPGRLWLVVHCTLLDPTLPLKGQLLLSTPHQCSHLVLNIAPGGKDCASTVCWPPVIYLKAWNTELGGELVEFRLPARPSYFLSQGVIFQKFTLQPKYGTIDRARKEWGDRENKIKALLRSFIDIGQLFPCSMSRISYTSPSGHRWQDLGALTVQVCNCTPLGYLEPGQQRLGPLAQAPNMQGDNLKSGFLETEWLPKRERGAI